MIDDPKKIKELTNLEIGRITNEGVNQTYQGNGSCEQGCIYDERSFNFHLLPECDKDFTKYSKKILKKRKELVDLLTEKINKYELGWQIEKTGNRGNIYRLKDKTKKKYKSGGNLFSFIRIRYNGVFYDINFNRFYIEQNRVYCELFVPQFSCCKCNPGYPESREAFKYSYGTMYYNPENNFSNEDELIKEFISFVTEKSKELLY